MARDKMRMTRHNSRGGRHSSKGYTAKHNDRNYDYKHAHNINPDKTKYNIYWSCYSGKEYLHGDRDEYPTFEDAEAKYYAEHFTAQWEAQNDRYRAQRQYKQIKDWDDWRVAKRYCPEECHLQIGCKGNTVDRKTVYYAMRDYIAALREYSAAHNNCLHILDYALHCDEAVHHLQIRYVWQSVDPETGILTIGQEKALERGGVEPPEPYQEIEYVKKGKSGKRKVSTRYNNRKITFDHEMREKYLDIGESYGLKIEREPEKDVEHNLYKEEMLERKNRELQEQIAELQEQNVYLESAYEDARNKNQQLWDANRELRAKGQQLQEQNKVLQDGIQELSEQQRMQIVRMSAQIQAENRAKQERQEKYAAMADEALPGAATRPGKHAGKLPRRDHPDRDYGL